MSGRDAASDRVGRVKAAAVGDKVKVERNRERFWVELTGTTPEGLLHGWVDNHLCQNPDLQYGDPVALRPADVLEIAHNSDSAAIHARAWQLQAGDHPLSHREAVQRAALEWWEQRLQLHESAPARPTAAWFLQTKIEPRSVPEALVNVARVVRY